MFISSSRWGNLGTVMAEGHTVSEKQSQGWTRAARPHSRLLNAGPCAGHVAVRSAGAPGVPATRPPLLMGTGPEPARCPYLDTKLSRSRKLCATGAAWTPFPGGAVSLLKSHLLSFL